MHKCKHAVCPEARAKGRADFTDLMKKMDEDTFYDFVYYATETAFALIGGTPKESAELRDTAGEGYGEVKHLLQLLNLMDRDTYDVWFSFASEIAKHLLEEQEERANG